MKHYESEDGTVIISVRLYAGGVSEGVSGGVNAYRKKDRSC